MFSVNTVIGQPGDFEKDRVGGTADYRWPEDSLQFIPDWVYTSPEIYQREVKQIFHGPTWNFVALEAEVPNPGDYKRSYVGPTPVVVARDKEGGVNVFENRCAHRGAEFCRAQRGNTKDFICPYHQWSYDLKGNLQGIPFKRGIKKDGGGMPADFKNEEHGLKKLRVGILDGVVFASFSDEVEPLETYLGPEILKDFQVVFKGRKLKILGYYRNELPGNWKLYHENLKDPYHATLLHSFLVTFGLMVAGSKNAMIADSSGRHGTMASAKPDNVATAVDAATKKEMRAFREDFKLADARFLEYVREFDSPWSVTMQTIWPNLIVQRELNTLGIRHIVPNGPHSMIMLWTMFGYDSDDEEMTRHRLRQGNLMGPSGFLGLEDNEAIKFVQEGVRRSPSQHGIVKLGGDTLGTTASLIDESAIRAMYRHYRQAMGL
jgi:anthranilate 1,2-dioxygenase large subunit